MALINYSNGPVHLKLLKRLYWYMYIFGSSKTQTNEMAQPIRFAYPIIYRNSRKFKIIRLLKTWKFSIISLASLFKTNPNKIGKYFIFVTNAVKRTKAPLCMQRKCLASLSSPIQCSALFLLNIRIKHIHIFVYNSASYTQHNNKLNLQPQMYTSNAQNIVMYFSAVVHKSELYASQGRWAKTRRLPKIKWIR